MTVTPNSCFFLSLLNNTGHSVFGGKRSINKKALKIFTTLEENKKELNKYCFYTKIFITYTVLGQVAKSC